jgi:hypothetical protein
MKGSWFIFDRFKAHEYHCRWRAPFWHGGRVMAKDSHHNYHLGFRCCSTVESRPAKKSVKPEPVVKPEIEVKGETDVESPETRTRRWFRR